MASCVGRFRESAPNEQVQLVCKVAALVRERGETLIERSGPFLGYSYASVLLDDGGLLDARGRLWNLLNWGWGPADSTYLSQNQCAVLERSLADVAAWLAKVHPSEAITILAEKVLTQVRRDWASLIGRQRAQENFRMAYGEGRANARWNDVSGADSAGLEPASRAHEDLAAWLAPQGVDSPVPRHLRPSLESEGGAANCQTRGCGISPDLAYSAFPTIVQGIRATDDFFISASRSNGYASFWGFACRSANVLVAIQLSSNRLGDGTSTFNTRILRLYTSLALPKLEEPSDGGRLDAVLVLSNFRRNSLVIDPTDPQSPGSTGIGVPSAIDDPRSNVHVLAALLAAVRESEPRDSRATTIG